MAHCILIPIGSAGDVHPLVGLGASLRRRGHRVTLVTNPKFEPLATRLDLEFAPLGTVEQFEQVSQDPDLWHPRKGFQLVARWGMLETIKPIYEFLQQHYQPGETVVAAQVTALGARIAHDRLGIPLATIHLQPAVLLSVHESPVLPPLWLGPRVPKFLKRFQYWLGDRLVGDRILAPATNAFRAGLGLPPVQRVISRWWHSPQRVVCLFPQWYAPPQPDWPAGTVQTGFPMWDEHATQPESEEFREYLAGGPPPVVFTPGSAMKHGHFFFAAAAEACRQRSVRGLFLTRYADQLPAPLPAEIRHFDFVPFSRVLPQAAALVHHGGIGSVAQALAAGIPQLVMPMAHDQPDNAARVERLGVGRSLAVSKFRGPAVAQALAAIQDDPAITRRCRDLAGRIDRHQPLEDAATHVEALIGADRATGCPDE